MKSIKSRTKFTCLLLILVTAILSSMTLFPSNVYAVAPIASPTASPAAGAVASGTIIYLSTTTPDASIYYTTNGSDPTQLGGRYWPENGITITQPVTIKAVAFINSVYSTVFTASYTIAEPEQPVLPSPRIIPKREAKTLTPFGQTEKPQTSDLSYLVAIPEQWMETTSQVEFWLDSEAIPSESDTSNASSAASINIAAKLLQTIGSTLLNTNQIDLKQRVTQKDGKVSESVIAQESIRGNFTIRLPIPASLFKTKNLGVVYIEDGTGLTANLTSKIVNIDGLDYIEFENNRSALYGFVSDKNNAATR